MSLLQRLLTLLTAGLSRVLELTLIVAFAVLVLDVLWGVFTRYVLASPSPWTEEVAQYLLMWVALLGSAVAYGRKAHLGLDYLVAKLDASAQRLNAVLVQVLVISFAGLVMVYGGLVMVSQTLAVDQRTAALDLPMGYVYLAVPISGVFIMMYALAQIAEVFGEQKPPAHNQPAAKGA